MMTKTISASDLAGLVADLIAGGTRVATPAKAHDGKVDYRWIDRFDEAVLGGPMPRLSLKGLFLPATEPLFRWQKTQEGVALEEIPTTFGPRVVLGARPCDAAAVQTLDKLMGWDYQDEPWFGRRAATTIVSLACDGVDRSCFCTSVGLAPDATKGSDVLLTPIPGGYQADAVTPKGETLLAAHAGRFRDGGDAAAADGYRKAARDKVAGNLPLDPAKVRTWIETHFEHPLWKEISLRCHGCGACASVCPTCHCFDIVDEPSGVTAGTRRRNWDTCQTALFTLHASGHNPRCDQCARIRQRVNHKYAIYPAKFGEIACTGCGRCARGCPGGQDIQEVLGKIMAL